MVTSFERISKWWLICAVTVLASACNRPSPDTVTGRARESIVASFDGVPIAYETRGAGPTALVFVHGWSCDRSYWEEQVESFSGDFQVVTVDLGGHGESGRRREDWTIESFGADVAAVVEALDLQRMVLIGHSMGGDVILEAARRLPGRAAGLVWADTYRQLGSTVTPDGIAEMVAPFRTDFVGSTRSFVRGMFPGDAEAALVERVANDMASAPPDVAVAAMESALSYGREVTRTVQELSLPVVAINASDPPTDIESMERYGVDVVLMPDVGHFLMLENPAGFNRLLRSVVDRWEP